MTEGRRKIGCILMAAGSSERFAAGNKLLAEFEGGPLIARPMKRLIDLRAMSGRTACDIDALTVTRWPEIEELCRAYDLPCVRYAGGPQSESIRAALKASATDAWDGCMFVSGDQPFVSEDSLLRLLETFKASPASVCRLAFHGQAGNPVIFPSSAFKDLMALSGDEGGRQLIKSGRYDIRLVEAASQEELMDIDTAADYAQLLIKTSQTPES